MTRVSVHTKAVDRLAKIAVNQSGYFTARQARQAGFQEATHPYHVRAGHWIREHRGIYRLSWFPRKPTSVLWCWFLWSADRLGEPQGTFSQQTALFLLGLSPNLLEPFLLTVPTHFRRNSDIPANIHIRKACLEPGDVQIVDSLRTTNALRTLKDLIGEKAISNAELVMLIEQAERKGLISASQSREINDKQMSLFNH
jgi:hypothetical protein